MKRVKHIPSVAFIIFLFALLAGPHLRAQVKGVMARIALVSDTHTTRGTKDDQPKYRARLDQVMAAANAAKVDLVLIAGDLTENGSPDELSDFQNQIKGFKAPVLFVPGNHDVGNKLIPGKGGTVTTERVAAFEKSLGPSFHAQTRAGVRVIGVNSPIFGSGFDQEKAMWEFLDKELAGPAPVPTVVFMHYPPFVKKADEGGGDYWNIEPEPRARLLALLRKGGVKTVLSGHLHRDLTNRHEGILFVTTRPVSFGLPKDKQPEGWTLVTLPMEGDAQVEGQTIGE
jgi:Icc protein